MAFRRTVASRSKILYQQQQRLSVPFSHVGRDDDSDREGGDILRRRLFGGGVNMFHGRRFAAPAALAMFSARNMSTFGEGAGAGAEKLVTMTDVADVLGETAAEAASQVAPVVANEVAVAAADSFLPVAALQYMIDYVHTFTGLDWWASIVATTILMRTLQLPLTINQMKFSSKLDLIKPQLEEIKENIMSRDMDPAAVAEGKERLEKLFDEYGVAPFSQLKGILFAGPVFFCFFLAINNMAEKVPSFKDGGALWFTDLTTPDATFILPVLTALTFWITVELNALEGMEGNLYDQTIKNACRVFAALTIPLTACFHKALFCYWITSNLYSLAYGLVMKQPEVKKMFGIPDTPSPPTPSTSAKPALSFSDALKKYAAALQQQLQPPPPPDSSPKHVNPRISSTSVLNRRNKSLAKEVKERKKGRKR